jgi:hypothetical protein
MFSNIDDLPKSRKNLNIRRGLVATGEATHWLVVAQFGETEQSLGTAPSDEWPG